MSDATAGREIKKVLVIGSGPIVIGQAAELTTPGHRPVSLFVRRGSRSSW